MERKGDQKREERRKEIVRDMVEVLSILPTFIAAVTYVAISELLDKLPWSEASKSRKRMDDNMKEFNSSKGVYESGGYLKINTDQSSRDEIIVDKIKK